MTGAILPSDPGTDPAGWSPDLLRLHRHLLHHPALLPRGASLLLAVSGGQDSIAMTCLLQALQRHHHWRLHLWHGDHGWRPESARQAEELAHWAARSNLPFTLERQPQPSAAGNREAIARQWRYSCLLRQAQRQGCSHVLTAHTASDRAETVLLHLARGSHQRGLASLRSLQPLLPLLTAATATATATAAAAAAAACGSAEGAARGGDCGRGQPEATAASAGAGCPEPGGLQVDGRGAAGPGADPAAQLQPRGGQPAQATICAALPRLQAEAQGTGEAGEAGGAPPWLVRPLQIFSRQDTERLCRQHRWPVWIDPGNGDARLSRNRIRAQVLPVLEQLHPGAARRISAQAERLAGELEQRQELLELALTALAHGGDDHGGNDRSGDDHRLDRRALLRLSIANQGSLLQHWLRRQCGRELDARSLQNLLPRLPVQHGPGHLDLAGGWQLRWRGSTLVLIAPQHPHEPSHG